MFGIQLGEGKVNRLAVNAQRGVLRVHRVRHEHDALGLHLPDQLIEAVHKLVDPFVLQAFGDGVHIHPNFCQLVHHLLGSIEVLGERVSWGGGGSGERLERAGGQGVDGVLADECVHIVGGGVVGVFGGGGSPQRTLHLCPCLAQYSEAFPFKEALVAGIGEFGVGDCRFAQQLITHADAVKVAPGGTAHIGVQQIIHQRINPTDEETCHRSHLAHVATAGVQAFDPADVRLCHRFVICHREDQGDVHANATGDSLFNRA